MSRTRSSAIDIPVARRDSDAKAYYMAKRVAFQLGQGYMRKRVREKRERSIGVKEFLSGDAPKIKYKRMFCGGTCVRLYIGI